MRKIGLFSSLLFMLAGCSGFSSVPEVDYIPEKIVVDQSWGLVDARGDLHADGQYAGEISPVVNGLFSVRNSAGVVSVWRATRKPVVVGELTGLRAAGYFAEGLIPLIDSDGAIRVADGFGRTRFVMTDFAGEKVSGCAARFSDGMLSVCTESGLWGAVDRQGNQVIAPEYLSEFEFFDGHAVVMAETMSLSGSTEQIRIIDKSGCETFRFTPSIWPEGRMSASGWIAYGSPGGYGIVNASGRRRALPPTVCGIHDFDDSSIIYIADGGYRGLMSMDGKIILPPRYNSLDYGAMGLMLASNSQRYLLIDRDGRIVSDFDRADEVVSFEALSRIGMRSRFGYAARFGALWALYDVSGNKVGNYEFSWLDISLITDVLQPLNVTMPIQSSGVGLTHGIEQFVPDSVSVIPDSLIDMAIGEADSDSVMHASM